VLKYQIDSQPEANYTSAITVQASYKSITFRLYDGNRVLDIETVLVVKDGEAGEDGGNGLNSAPVFLFTSTPEDSPAPSKPSTTAVYTFSSGEIAGVNNNWSKAIPSTSNRFKWMIVATAVSASAKDSIAPSEWSDPVIVFTDGIPGTRGASIAYRGDWKSNVEYSGNDLVVDFVKYNNVGYLARQDAGDIPPGTLPTNTDYWNQVTNNPDAIFTDFLIAYSAYIDNLTVGVLQTAEPPASIPAPSNDAERTTIGYAPVHSEDPTNVYSRHSPRGYYPSGRIMWTITYIPADHPIVFGDHTYADTGAILFYKDEEGSPLHFILDSNIT